MDTSRHAAAPGPFAWFPVPSVSYVSYRSDKKKSNVSGHAILVLALDGRNLPSACSQPNAGLTTAGVCRTTIPEQRKAAQVITLTAPTRHLTLMRVALLDWKRGGNVMGYPRHPYHRRRTGESAPMPQLFR